MFEESLVVVSDSMNAKRSYSIYDSNTEGYSKRVIEGIMAALRNLSRDVVLVDDIEQFARMLPALSGAVVIPCYFGKASRVSKSLVPALCDAAQVPFVGADAYAQTLCNDKYFSRLYANEFGLRVPSAILVCSEADISERSFNRLVFPVVVKPNFGGGSNGIDSRNLCYAPEEAIDLCRRLLGYQRVPLTVESYVPGEEIQVIFADLPQGEMLVEQIAIRVNGKAYFDHELFDLSVKKRGQGSVSFETVHLVCEDDLLAMRRIYDALGKVQCMRIDCRVSGQGRATLLELSPDCSLSPKSGVYQAFSNRGFSYEEMFSVLIESALSSSR